jgi:endonuclease IV
MLTGLSTSCMYKTAGIADAVRMYREAGAKAVELHFRSPEVLTEFQLTPDLKKDLSDFSHVSVHAPYGPMVWRNSVLAKDALLKLSYIRNDLEHAGIKLNGVVIHPNELHEYDFLAEYMTKYELSILVENLPSSSGSRPENFSKIAQYPVFGFVFDAEHAYQSGNAHQILKAMDGRIKHVHVAGSKSENGKKTHLPFYSFPERERIRELACLCPGVPVISEAIYSAWKK